MSWPCGRTMVFSRLLITIRHSSFRTRFRTVFSHTAANRVSLRTHTNTHDDVTLKQATQSTISLINGRVLMLYLNMQ